MPNPNMRQQRKPFDQYLKAANKRQSQKYMKKTTKTGAYKKQRKKQMMLRRAPVVEMKTRNHASVEEQNGYEINDNPITGNNPLKWRSVPTDDAFSLIPLDSYYRMSQGLKESQCIGKSITSRWLQLRTEFRFPYGGNITLIDGSTSPPTAYQAINKVIQEPTKLYLICGWVTRKWGLPVEELNADNTLTTETADQKNLLEYITSQIKPYFDEATDRLRFHKKRTMNVKVESYRKIEPNLNNSISSQIQPEHVNADPDGTGHVIQAMGSLPPVLRSHKWTIGRKLQLTEGVAEPANTEDDAPPVAEQDLQNLYPNDAWLPFAVIHNPNFLAQQAVLANNVDPGNSNRFLAGQFIQFRYNDQHTYTDS